MRSTLMILTFLFRLSMLLAWVLAMTMASHGVWIESWFDNLIQAVLIEAARTTAGWWAFGFTVGTATCLLFSGRLVRGVLAPLRRHRCASCGYDMSGATTSTCPECGFGHETVGRSAVAAVNVHAVVRLFVESFMRLPGLVLQCWAVSFVFANLAVTWHTAASGQGTEYLIEHQIAAVAVIVFARVSWTMLRQQSNEQTPAPQAAVQRRVDTGRLVTLQYLQIASNGLGLLLWGAGGFLLVWWFVEGQIDNDLLSYGGYGARILGGLLLIVLGFVLPRPSVVWRMAGFAVALQPQRSGTNAP